MATLRARIATILALALFSFMNISNADAATTGIVRGNVTVHGTVTSGVTVTLRGAETTLTTSTDANGNYAFPLVPFGHYELTAHYDSHPDATAEVDVASSLVATVALQISPLHVIAQTVATATSRGVGGTPVSENILGGAEIQALPQNQNLNRLVETVPGIVQFSYDEPVAHGFHGVTYELDGAPFPLSTASNFSQVVDPRMVQSMEIFTGAFPAEFGGQRMGAVVNLITKNQSALPTGAQLTAGVGTYGTTTGNLLDGIDLGQTHVFLNYHLQSTNRGIDSPTADSIHDAANLSSGFFHTTTDLGAGSTLAFDYSNQFSAFQIPINLTANANDPVVNLATQDDVQREYTSFADLNFTHTTPDARGYFQIIPWWKNSRTVYAGDLPADIQAVDTSDSDCAPAPAPCPLAGLSQDRGVTYFGLRTAYFHSSTHHALKTGIDWSGQSFNSNEQILLPGSPPFFDNVAQHGVGFAAYVQDDWTPSNVFGLHAGVRYDFSNGFVEGNELQPRIGADFRVGPDTIFHAYYGRVYAAPFLEDTRRAAVIVGGGSLNALPVYDLKPEHDSYYELGLGQTFRNGLYGYLNAWERNAWNILDTTQIFPTPIFAVFNNAFGVARGLELRLQQRGTAYSWFLSASDAQSNAGGISGATFLFPPSAISDTSLQPEDHDQTVAIKDEFIKYFGTERRLYASLGSDYGTGYPVQFENGPGRLLPHLTFDASIGRAPTKGSLGFSLTALNLTNYKYLIKVSNGFNTTQWSPGIQMLFQVSAAIQ